MEPLKTPILFLIFNRPALTQQVFDRIKKVKPEKLYISADGPRPGRPSDQERCAEARRIIDQIDWDCQLHTNYREQNVGCKLGVSTGIDWLFENEEEGIILEDDCLPDTSFFYFCQTLLERYRNEERIFQINGSAFWKRPKNLHSSYYFSKYNLVWGWATWKRAWKHYDRNMDGFQEFVEQQKIKSIFQDKTVQDYWVRTFTETRANKVDTWDFQWSFTTLNLNKLSITPCKNLVSNIGHGAEATHTLLKYSPVANLRSQSIGNITHPEKLEVRDDADNDIFKYWNMPLHQKVYYKLLSVMF